MFGAKGGDVFGGEPRIFEGDPVFERLGKSMRVLSEYWKPGTR